MNHSVSDQGHFIYISNFFILFIALSGVSDFILRKKVVSEEKYIHFGLYYTNLQGWACSTMKQLTHFELKVLHLRHPSIPHPSDASIERAPRHKRV